MPVCVRVCVCARVCVCPCLCEGCGIVKDKLWAASVVSLLITPDGINYTAVLTPANKSTLQATWNIILMISSVLQCRPQTQVYPFTASLSLSPSHSLSLSLSLLLSLSLSFSLSLSLDFSDTLSFVLLFLSSLCSVSPISFCCAPSFIFSAYFLSFCLSVCLSVCLYVSLFCY